jgi:3-hydroxyacyl-[acyl-carrier-protein] dehydratase
MPLLARKDIEAILPHRDPFLFVATVTAIDEGKRIEGDIDVDATSAFSVERDGRRLVPATILAEAMAQLGAILVLYPEEHRGRTIYFRSIEKAEFREEILAGAHVRVEAVVIKIRSRFGSLTVKAWRDDTLVVDAVMSFALG